MPPKDSKANTRRRHTNSRLGCQNCKRKKIRCDESLPLCENCTRGKKETCSYLTLSENELNRIKITHSLRSSQNKLLQHNYRLPTSSNIVVVSSTIKPKKRKVDTQSNFLEFKYELTRLPLKFPVMARYPPVQFNNLSINDFNEDGELEEDLQKSLDSGSESEDSKSLRYGMAKPTTFERIRYSEVFGTRVTNVDLKPTEPKLSFHILQGEFSLLDHLHDLLNKRFADENIWESTKILIDAFICLGQVTMLNQMKASNKVSTDVYSDAYIELIERNSFEKHGSCIYGIGDAIQRLMKDMETRQGDVESINGTAMVLAYANCFTTFANIMLNFSAESYFKSAKNLLNLFENYSKFLLVNNIDKPDTVFQYLVNNMQYNFMSITIPLYDPQFLVELCDNLSKLQPIYQNEKIQFPNSSSNKYYRKLQSQYTNLFKFVKNDILPSIFRVRNETRVTAYPANIIFTFLKKWLTIFPSEAMMYNTRTVPESHTIEGQYLMDLTNTLYLYYSTTSVLFESIFPSCKYLFSISFMTPTNEFYNDSECLTVHRTNYYHETLEMHFGFKSAELLQRENYYISRIMTFFKNRYVFFLHNTIWKKQFKSEHFCNNRLSSRVAKNVLEIPIHSFNTTLIRPEHYPSRIHGHYDHLLEDPSVHSILTRTDECIDQRFYSRNIETVNFFDPQCKLQFDFSYKLLLRDYRPDLTHTEREKVKLGVEDIKQYYEDRALIVSSHK